MIICICQRVTDRDITRMSRSGASFDELQLELGVATQCRSCEGCARELHAQCQASGATAFCRAVDASMISHQPTQRLSLQAA
jgi:bacterioferritin-associated ferredoxin